MTKLAYRIPFSGYAELNPLNTFASVHTYLTDPNCVNSLAAQEYTYFLLDTLSGCASWLADYEGKESEPIDNVAEVLDFCMKFCGYTYKIVKENLHNELLASIETGYPVLAEMKSQENGSCRVLIGCEDGKPVMAEPTGAQEPPSTAPAYEEIIQLYVITGRTEPTKFLSDGLCNIIAALEKAAAVGVWENARNKFDFYSDTSENMDNLSLDEIRSRFVRIHNIAWNFDRCHNFSEALIRADYKNLPEKTPITDRQDALLREYAHQIDAIYFSTHENQWLLIGLHDCRHWDHKEWYSKEVGLCTCVRWAMEKLAENDRKILEIVRQMLAVLEA